jgi:K(+)-stimulated pyrophosphate-energized sodium pump
MSHQPDSVRAKTDALDSAGNTTKALTKGYAIGSASLAAFLLFSAYLEEVHTIVVDKVTAAGPAGYMPPGWSFTNINLAEIPVFVGALLGAMLVFLFSSLAIKAVGRTAQKVVQDVRDQFRENPGIMEGTSKPNYARCVSIVTGAALKEMVLPGLLVVGLPSSSATSPPPTAPVRSSSPPARCPTSRRSTAFRSTSAEPPPSLAFSWSAPSPASCSPC